MGGAFGLPSAQPPWYAPSQAALPGFVKSLAQELAGVHCKAIDLDPRSPPQVLATQIATEILACDGEVEVGYRAQRRLVVCAAPARVGASGARGSSFGVHSVFFITGGGRGICAELACALARRYSA